MNPTRWAFLADGIQKSEEQRLEIVQWTVAKALGIALVPIRDEKTGLLRLPETFAEMPPLLPAIASEPFAARIKQLWEEMDQQQEVAMPDADEIQPAPTGPETGIDFLDKPIDVTKLSEAERRQYMQAIGIVIGTPPPPGEEAPQPKRAVPRGSFRLDD
jgi:hypothetical protein